MFEHFKIQYDIRLIHCKNFSIVVLTTSVLQHLKRRKKKNNDVVAPLYQAHAREFSLFFSTSEHDCYHCPGIKTNVSY